MLRQATEFIVPVVSDVSNLVRVDADRGIDKRVPFGKLDRSLAGGQISADRDECIHAGFPRARDHRLAVVVVARIVQVRVCVDQHRRCGADRNTRRPD